MKFKIPKLGEGDRVRKPSTRTDVGGEARRAAGKTKVSISLKKNKPSVHPGARLAQALRIPAIDANEDLPDPGEHPKVLREKAEARGHKPPVSGIAALRARANALADETGVAKTDGTSTSADDFLDKFLERKPAQERTTQVSTADKRALVFKARQRLSILRPIRSLDYEPQDSTDNASDGQQNATERSVSNGGGRADEGSGSSEQLSDSESFDGELVAGSFDVREAVGTGEAGRSTAESSTVYSGDPGEDDGDISERAQPVFDAGEINTTDGDVDGGSASERRREETEACASHEGEESDELTAINALEIDPRLYEDTNGKATRRGRARTDRADRGESHVQSTASNVEAIDSAKANESQSDRGPEAQGTRNATESVTEIGRLRLEAAPEKRGLPLIPSTEFTEYNERQEYEIASLFNISEVVCDNCLVAERCPEFKEGCVCAYEETMSGMSSRDIKNVLPTMEVIADLQMRRARRAVFVERMSGGVLDANTSRQLEIAAAAVERVARIKAGPQVFANRSITVTSSSSAGGGGMLTKLIEAIAPAPALPEGTTTIVEMKEAVPLMAEGKRS